MKYLRIFEEYNEKDWNKKHYHDGKFYPGGISGPLVGDYAIIKRNNKNVLGVITDVDEDAPGNIFKVMTVDYQEKFWFMSCEILYYSKNIEDLDVYLDVDKYNL